VNRFPHDPHSPVTFPFSSVENRNGPPHSRQGRARGVPNRSASPRGARGRAAYRAAGASPRLGARTKVSDVPHASHVATRLVAEEFLTASGPPQSPQEGLGTGGPAAGAPEPTVPDPSAGPFEASDGAPSRTMVNVPPHPAQLP